MIEETMGPVTIRKESPMDVQFSQLTDQDYRNSVSRGTDTSGLLSGGILESGAGMQDLIRRKARSKFDQEMGMLGQQIGNQSRKASTATIQQNLALVSQKMALDEEKKRLEEEKRAARKRARAGIVGSVSGIVGAGVGFAAGGPEGALIGYNLGQGAGTYAAS